MFAVEFCIKTRENWLFEFITARNRQENILECLFQVTFQMDLFNDYSLLFINRLPYSFFFFFLLKILHIISEKFTRFSKFVTWLVVSWIQIFRERQPKLNTLWAFGVPSLFWCSHEKSHEIHWKLYHKRFHLKPYC